MKTTKLESKGFGSGLLSLTTLGAMRRAWFVAAVLLGLLAVGSINLIGSSQQLVVLENSLFLGFVFWLFFAVYDSTYVVIARYLPVRYKAYDRFVLVASEVLILGVMIISILLGWIVGHVGIMAYALSAGLVWLLLFAVIVLVLRWAGGLCDRYMTKARKRRA